jgi:hypothetical protein
MRSAATIGVIPDVASAPRRRLILEVEDGSDPIVGCVRDEQAASFDFSGWLGFASALQEALTATVDSPSAVPSASPLSDAERSALGGGEGVR